MVGRRAAAALDLENCVSSKSNPDYGGMKVHIQLSSSPVRRSCEVWERILWRSSCCFHYVKAISSTVTSGIFEDCSSNIAICKQTNVRTTMELHNSTSCLHTTICRSNVQRSGVSQSGCAQRL